MRPRNRGRGNHKKPRAPRWHLLREIGLTTQEYRNLSARPLDQRTQRDEMKLAYVEGRQPLCVFCERPLEEIRQVHHYRLLWRWDEEAGTFTTPAEADRSADKPYCLQCDHGDWEYIDNRLVDL